MTDSNDEHTELGVREPAPRRPYAEDEVSLQDVRRKLSTIQGSDGSGGKQSARGLCLGDHHRPLLLHATRQRLLRYTLLTNSAPEYELEKLGEYETIISNTRIR